MKKISSDVEIEKTKDGSHTLYSTRFNQQYHNSSGAISESKHVFFEKNGLRKTLKTDAEINILEVGFGTGLNLLLLLDEYLKVNSSAKINYHAVEAFPVSAETVELLNYGTFLDHSKLIQQLPPIFKSLKKGVNEFNLLEKINVTVFFGDFGAYQPANTTFDYIFHDAFSPSANPGLWTDSVFKKLLKCSNTGALLTTYCAASKIRGAMAFAGWKVARAAGALRKREMTVASPSAAPLEKFKRVNEQRLAKRFAENEFY